MNNLDKYSPIDAELFMDEEHMKSITDYMEEEEQ